MDMVSTNAILALGNAINQKSSLLMKMEDHMYLNPLSKTRNVPKQAEEKKPESKFGKFGGVDSVKFGG
jgi:hypothetical protein